MATDGSGDGSGVALTLKDRVQAMISDIAKFKDSYQQNIKFIEDEKQTIMHLESDLLSIKQKMKDLEVEYEILNSKLGEATERFDETVKGADEAERQRRILDQKKDVDEVRLAALEQFIRETTEAAVDSEKKCEEVSKKLAATEADSERAKKRTELAEKKSKELQNEMRSMSSKLREMQTKIEKANESEEKYERIISDWKAQLKNMEKRATDSDALMERLQREVDKVKDELQETMAHYQLLRKETGDGRGYGIRAVN